MATKKYLYKKSSGEWVFGAAKNSICPAGVYRLEIEGTGLTLRHIYNRDTAERYKAPATDFLKENGAAYASVTEFFNATIDFFSNKAAAATSDTPVKNAVDLVTVAVGNVSTAVGLVTAAIAALKNKQFPAGIHILTGTEAATAGSYTGFLILEEATLTSITLTDATKVTGTNDFSGITLSVGTFIEIPGGFSSMTLASGSVILAKAA